MRLPLLHPAPPVVINEEEYSGNSGAAVRENKDHMAATRPFVQDGGRALFTRSDRGLRAEEDRSRVADEVVRHFEELRGPVYAYLYSFCRNAERAEEMTQDVFLRLHAYLQAGNTIDSPRSWVFRVAHNLAVNEAKKQRFEVPREEGESGLEACDPAPDPEMLLLGEERSALFLKGLAALTEHQRYCLQLRAEGLQIQEIAEALKISRSGVADALQRALKRLRKVIL